MKGHILLLSPLLVLQNVVAQNTGQGISVTVTPSNGLTNPGRTVTFVCTLDLTIMSDTPVMWSHLVGTIRTDIALGTSKKDEFVSMLRYKVQQWTDSAKVKKTYTLTISRVEYEDSGMFVCSIPGSSRKDSKTLAVCANTDSDSCKCAHQKGWLTPECFGESKSQEEMQTEYDRTVTGLGVCFAIAVIYGIIITVLFARDCVHIMAKKRRRKAQQLKAQQQKGYNPYADSEKLTVDDDAGSIPESGVWSQSDGNNGNRGSDRSNHGNGGHIISGRSAMSNKTSPPDPAAMRDRPVLRPQERPVMDDGPPTKPVHHDRQLLTVQAHVNPAYSPDDVDNSLTGHGATTPVPLTPSGGVRRKVPSRAEPSPRSPYPQSSYPESSTYHDNQYTENKGPYTIVGEPPPRYPDQSTAQTPQPPEAYRPRGNLTNNQPPSSVRSEGRGAPERPPPPQRSYTDVPSDKHSGQVYDRHAEPRRLEFGRGDSGSGQYIDDHDTVI